MSHVTHMIQHEWNISTIWMSHVTHTRCHGDQRAQLYVVLSGSAHPIVHIQKSHGTHVIESCLTHEWVMSNSHVPMAIGAHNSMWWLFLGVHISWCTYEWVMSHICMSQVEHINESCDHIKESCPSYERVMSHIMSHIMSHVMSHIMSHIHVASYRT